jgi:hypothetical protein
MLARLADQPAAADWQMIETSRDFAQSLDAVNHTALARFVTRLGRESTRASVESALQQAWAELVAELAGWVPGPWRPALRWITPLPHLRLAAAERATGIEAPEVLAEMPGDEAAISDAWRAEFDARLPGAGPELTQSLAPLFERFLAGPPQPSAQTTALTDHLSATFRIQAQQPAAAFAWLGIMALSFERLRGALLRAMIFPARADREGR